MENVEVPLVYGRVGEWKESPERFPNTLKAVCDYAKEKGMVMGLWLEIEVMGVACELANKLPDDWFICRHGKRHIDNKRYLLDFRNPEVRKYCMDVVDRLIEDYGVGYFKVDYNVTMGYGSDLYADSCADAIRDHYLYLYEWYKCHSPGYNRGRQLPRRPLPCLPAAVPSEACRKRTPGHRCERWYDGSWARPAGHWQLHLYCKGFHIISESLCVLHWIWLFLYSVLVYAKK